MRPVHGGWALGWSRSGNDFRGGSRPAQEGLRCGDPACGFVSCTVSRDGEHVSWTALGYENDDDAQDSSRFPMGGFRFRAEELAGALRLPSGLE